MPITLRRPDDGVDQTGLDELVNKFLASEEASEEEREWSERDRDYVDGYQWTAAQTAALTKRGQAAIVINRMRRKHNWLMGSEVLQRTDPRAFPRTPNHEDAAEAATDAIRYVCDNNNYDVVRSEVWDNLVVEGKGGAEVYVTPKSDGDIEIKITQIPWDRIFTDPHSRKRDYSDAMYMGYITWMDVERAKEKWPDASDAFDTIMTAATTSETYDDRPKHTVWADTKRRRVRIVQMFFLKKDAWHGVTFTSGQILAGNKPMAYVDENGTPENPLILTSAYVDRENRRYGEMRELIGPQDEINHRRSKALYMMSARQVIADEDAVKDVRKAKEQLSRADGWIEVNPGSNLELSPTNDMAAAQFDLLAEAKSEIDGMGPNASLQGKQPQALSGRALIAQQQGGSTELGSITDSRRQWDLRVYRQVWNRVRQFWTAERWIRVTDSENNLKFVGLNQPKTRAEMIMEEGERRGEDMQEIQAGLQLIPDADEVLEIENNVAELDVDITVSDVPDNVSLQSEQFEMLAKMVQAGLPIPPDIIIEIAPNLRDKDRILERLRGSPEDQEQQQEAAQQQNEMKQRAAMAQLAGLEAEAEKTAAEVGKVEAETQDELASARERIAKSQVVPFAR